MISYDVYLGATIDIRIVPTKNIGQLDILYCCKRPYQIQARIEFVAWDNFVFFFLFFYINRYCITFIGLAGSYIFNYFIANPWRH